MAFLRCVFEILTLLSKGNGRHATCVRRTNWAAWVAGECLLAAIISGCGGGTPAPPPPALTISTHTLGDGTVTFPYTQTIQASGGVGAFTWTVNAGSLPHNLSLGNNSGPSTTIAGVPDTIATARFTIEVRDSSGQIATQSYSLSIGKTVSAHLQPATEQVPGGIIEIRGLSAGDFNPRYWRQNTLNWVADVREPMFTSLTTSPYQNIYSPFPLEQSGGWRMFYGGWDGSDTPNDRIYSVTTADFLIFNNRMLVIDHGAFQHVNDVNVQQLPDGSLHMTCTGGAYDGRNWPTYFSSPDGVVWNGTTEPYQAQLSDIVNIQGYSDYQAGGFNAGNVLFRETSDWVLYFYDNFGTIAQIYRATGTSPQVVQFQSVALKTGADPNSVNKFVVANQTWYLMGLMSNAPQVWYSLSNDGLTFMPMQTLFFNLSALDSSMDTVSFVTKGSQVLGTLYGANTGTPDNQLSDNAIFARWLQKKIVITDSSGTQYFAQGSYGPDRQWFQMPTSGSLQVTILVYSEDGVTPLASGSVTVSGGNAYQLVLGDN